MSLSLNQYLDTMVNTGPVFLSGEDNIINNVSRRSFIIGKMLRGSSASTTLQGGDKIQETLYLNANRTFQSYGRNADVSWQNPQKDVLLQLDWRFHIDHMSFDEVEYAIQTGGRSGDSLKTKYKDMAYSKQQRMWESAIDGFETKLWNPPATTPTETTTYATMEGATASATEMYSIPVFVNEQDGSTGGFNDGWTTIENVNLAANANWRCQRSTYDAADIMDADLDGDGLFDGLEDLSINTGFQQPGFKDEYFEPDTHYSNGGEKKSHPVIIATSKLGLKQIMRAHRQSNESLITPQDAAYPKPKWNGIAVTDVQALDSAALYRNTGDTAFVGEAAATVNKSGARYYMLNTNYLKTIFHSQKYFTMRKPKELERKVGVFVVPVEVYGNLCCTSLRNQGILSPA